MPPKSKKVHKYYSVTTRDKRVFSGIRLVDLKKRNPALPPVYRYVDGVHPLRRDTSGSCVGGNTYIYLVDPSDAGRDTFQSLASGINVPGGMINQPGGNPGELFHATSNLVFNFIFEKSFMVLSRLLKGMQCLQEISTPRESPKKTYCKSLLLLGTSDSSVVRLAL